MEDRRRQRILWAGAGVGAAVLHLMLMVVLRPDPDLAYDLPEAPDAIQVTLVRPPERPREEPDDAPRTPATREAVTPFPDRASLPSTRGQGPSPPQASPSAAVTAPSLPAAPGSGTGPGVNWTATEPPDGALRRALRRSVGCDYGLKLTKEEQAACDERFGKGRLKEGPTLPVTADRRRMRELERQGEQRMRQHDYKRQPAPVGTFNDLRDMGGKPPQ